MNPLQELIADAMQQAGMPLDQRGSVSEAARRCNMPRHQFGYIFSRERYVPTAPTREKLCAGLAIAARRMEEAAYETREGVSIHAVFDRGGESIRESIDQLDPEELERVAQYAHERLQQVKRGEAKP